MWRVVKLLIFLIILAAIGLVAFAYLGPLLGADFTAPQSTKSIPVEFSLD